MRSRREKQVGKETSVCLRAMGQDGEPWGKMDTQMYNYHAGCYVQY